MDVIITNSFQGKECNEYVHVFNWIDANGVLQVWNRAVNWKPDKEELWIIGVWRVKKLK